MPTFAPPFLIERPVTGVRLIDVWVKIPRAQTVLKNQNGSYSIGQFFSQDDLAGAAVVYLGGHVYPVSTAEAALLTTAGYGASIGPDIVVPGPTPGSVNPAAVNGVPSSTYTLEYGVSY